MNVLLECAKRKIPTRETAICAVYPAGGAGTLFSAFVYYLRAYGNVIKFSLSSLAGFATDYALFNLFLALTPGMGEMSLDFSNYAARAVSASVNYAINRRLVFKNDDRVLKTAVQYFALAALISVGNTALLEVLTETVRLGAQIAKLLTELAFFLASFVVQRFVIFRKQKKRAKPFE